MIRALPHRYPVDVHQTIDGRMIGRLVVIGRSISNCTTWVSMVGGLIRVMVSMAHRDSPVIECTSKVHSSYDRMSDRLLCIEMDKLECKGLPHFFGPVMCIQP